MSSRVSVPSALLQWSGRRWRAAIAAAVLTYLVIAVPTDLIDTPLFSREIPPTWWAFPVLGITAVLTGLLVATYVARAPAPANERHERLGIAGTVVSFFAVGCPVCNKLVLVALGSSGAVQYFEPLQPLLAIGSIGLLVWAFLKRVTSEYQCPVPRPRTATATPSDG